MKPTHQMTIAFGLFLAGASQAQTNTNPQPDSAGLLGQRYAEMSFGIHDQNLVRQDGYSLGGRVNFPVVPALLDAGATYGYDWRTEPYRTNASTFGTYATAYVPLRAAKPFLSTGLGWRTKGIGPNGFGLWDVTTGIEIGQGDFSVTPRVTYTTDFKDSRVSSQQWGWSVEGNCWVSRTAGLFAAVGRSEVLHRPAHSLNYVVGLRLKI